MPNDRPTDNNYSMDDNHDHSSSNERGGPIESLSLFIQTCSHDSFAFAYVML